MKKYNITIEVAGTKIRIKDIEAKDRESAEFRALVQAKSSIKVIESSEVPKTESNAKPVSMEDAFRRFFSV